MSSFGGYWDDERKASVFLIANGRIREQRHVPEWGAPYGDLEGFISKLRELAKGLEHVTISWHREEDGASLFIMGDRERTARDDAWLKKAKQKQDERDRREIEFLQRRLAASHTDSMAGLDDETKQGLRRIQGWDDDD